MSRIKWRMKAISSRVHDVRFQELDDVYAHLAIKVRKDDTLPISFDNTGGPYDVTHRDFL